MMLNTEPLEGPENGECGPRGDCWAGGSHSPTDTKGSASPSLCFFDHGLGDILGCLGLSPALGSLPHFLTLSDIRLITSVLSHSVVPSLSQPLLQGSGRALSLHQAAQPRQAHQQWICHPKIILKLIPIHHFHAFLQTFSLRCGSFSSQSCLRARGDAAAQSFQPGVLEVLLSSGCWC